MTQFFGHFHPLLVHFPIGLIILLALLETLSRYPRFKGANSSARFILLLAVPFAVFTALCGWLLSLHGNYDRNLIQWHMWTGIGTAIACAIVGLSFWLDWKRSYRFFLFLTIIVLVIASHLGGSITHGRDYLVRFAPQSLQSLFIRPEKQQIRVTSVADLHAFHDVIQPILRNNCVGCHGSEKAEAELRLDSYAGLLKGGKSGPVLLTDKMSESSLLNRLRLPVQHKEHMPPEGKPQPTSEEISWLQWWIKSGASENSTVAQLKAPSRILRSLQTRYGIATNSIAGKARPLSEIQPLIATLSDQLGIVVTTLSPNESWLQCNASVAGKSFGDAELEQLVPFRNNIRRLDLAGTKVSDAGMVHVAAMPNLIRLHLERTAITDEGVARLATLPELQYLNLYGTKITDRALNELQLLPNLKQVYIWQTKVTPAAAKAFAESLTDEEEVQRWREEIALINAKIKTAHVIVDLGTPEINITNSAPINSECPVSGKAVDPTKSISYEGSLIAFCCDDCREKFRRDPKSLLSKLQLKSSSEAKPVEK
jgi:uncharacterized membrane protein/YHS domain-containing protein